MPLDLDAIEAKADDGDLPGALAALREAAPRDAREAAAAARLHASLLARAGDLDAALAALDASPAPDRAGQLEGDVLRASVWAAQGHVHRAVRLLGDTITALRAEPALRELRADAEAELESYRALLARPR
jgi:hypothetical protein